MAAYPAWAEGIAVVTGAIGVWQSVRERPSTWVWGQASVIVYAYILYQERLYGALVLQAAYTVSNVYGFLAWMRPNRHREDVDSAPANKLAVGRATPSQLIGVAVAALAAAVAMGYINTRLHAAVPVPDAALSALSLAAQYLLARKRAETWLLWIVADGGYAVLYIYQGLWLTAGLYTLFVAMAIVGWRRWREEGV